MEVVDYQSELQHGSLEVRDPSMEVVDYQSELQHGSVEVLDPSLENMYYNLEHLDRKMKLLRLQMLETPNVSTAMQEL